MVYVTLLVAWTVSLQAPWKGENLQYFPNDISREFEGVSLASDEKPAKANARAMLRMVEQINTVALAQLRVAFSAARFGRVLDLSPRPRPPQIAADDALRSHRGGSRAAAIAKCRDLRRNALLGQYNFGEWEINELAPRLAEGGNAQGAIDVLETNREYYPASTDIPRLIAEAKKRLAP